MVILKSFVSLKGFWFVFLGFLLFSACYEVTAPSGPYTCSSENQTCPTGFHCTHKTCIPNKPCSTTVDCDDQVACTEDICRGDVCYNLLKADYCLIDGVCWSKDVVNPHDICQVCQPLSEDESFQWTQAAANAPPFGGMEQSLLTETNGGPSLAYLENRTFLFFSDPQEQQVFWEAVKQCHGWESLKKISNQPLAQSEFNVIATGTALEGSSSTGLYFVFRGKDSKVWYSWRPIDGSWQNPKTLSVLTSNAPSAAMVAWNKTDDPSLTVGYINQDKQISVTYYENDKKVWRDVAKAGAENVLPNGYLGMTAFNHKVLLYFSTGLPGDSIVNIIYTQTLNSLDPQWKSSTIRTSLQNGDEPVRSDFLPASVEYRDNLYMAFKGHENFKVWVWRTSDGENWTKLGYVTGIETEEKVALTKAGPYVDLAFKPLHGKQLCLGWLDLDGWQKAGPIAWRPVNPQPNSKPEECLSQ